MSTKKNILLFAGFFLILFSGFCQNKFDNEIAFLWKLKYDSTDIGDFTQEYIYRFEKESYHLFKNDEFEMNEAKNELSRRVNELEAYTIYIIKYDSEFAAYDFEREGFACSPFDENTKIEILSYTFGSKLMTNTALSLQFLNSKEIAFFPMSKEEANMLLKERKNYKNGKIDRSVTLGISFIINGNRNTETASNKYESTLTANILQVEFLDKHGVLDVPFGTIPTAFKAEFEEMTKIKDESKKLKPPTNNSNNKNKSADSEAVNQINSIISNTSLSDEEKARLIKSTLEYYQNEQNPVLTNN